MHTPIAVSLAVAGLLISTACTVYPYQQPAPRYAAAAAPRAPEPAPEALPAGEPPNGQPTSAAPAVYQPPPAEPPARAKNAEGIEILMPRDEATLHLTVHRARYFVIEMEPKTKVGVELDFRAPDVRNICFPGSIEIALLDTKRRVLGTKRWDATCDARDWHGPNSATLKNDTDKKQTYFFRISTNHAYDMDVRMAFEPR